MTETQSQTLREHVAATPELKALADVGDDTGLAAAMNAPTGDPVPGLIDIASVEALLHTFAHASGAPAWLLIEDYAAGGESLPLRYACRMAVAMVNSKYKTIDFRLPAVQTFLGGLVAGTLLTQGQADALAGLSARKWSVAEAVLGVAGVVVTREDAGGLR